MLIAETMVDTITNGPTSDPAVIVRRIMVETFTSRIKVSNFAKLFVLGYLLRKNMAPREIQTLTLGAIKRWRKGGVQIYIEHLQLFIR